MKLLEFISRIDRGIYVFILGFIALTLSICFDWFIVPSSFLSNTDLTKDFVIHPITILEIIERTLIFIFAVSSLIVFLANPQFSRLCRQFSKFILFFVLMFPFLMVNLYPEYGMDSRLIYRQVDQVIEDMEHELNLQQLDWDQQRVIRIQKSLIASMDTTIFDESWGIELFLAENQTYLLQNFLGFSNEFLNVVSKGWVSAIVGVILVNLGLYLLEDENKLSYKIKRGANWALILIFGLLVGPKMMGFYYIEQGKFYYARGDYPEASKNWQTAAEWNHNLYYSMPYYARLGELDLQRGCTECEAVPVYLISNAVTRGKFKELEGLLDRLQKHESTIPGLRYWKAAFFTEQGIDAFNSGQYSLAEEFWNKALLMVPTSATAYYGLSLVYMKYKQFDKAAQTLAHQIRLQNYLSFKKMTISGQYYLMESWNSISKGDLVMAHYYYSLYLTPDNWQNP